jgi:hypothetical protein
MVNGRLIFSFALAQLSSKVVKLLDRTTPQGAGVRVGGGSVIYDCGSLCWCNFVAKRFFDFGFGVDWSSPIVVAPAQAGVVIGLYLRRSVNRRPPRLRGG